MNENVAVSPFKDIEPYSQTQINEALKWLANSDVFIKGVQFIHTAWTKKQIVEKLEKCNSCADFQVFFIEPMIKKLISKTIDKLSIVGLETLSKEDNHLYISNHRDIFLDSGLLQYQLYHIGYRFTEISLGDNLIVNEVMEKVAKLNNMFTVIRNGTKMEQFRNAKTLSSYLRHAITNKRVSTWIAQGNGRTKNGNDQTFPGLINMLLLDKKVDLKEELKELNIVVASVSYEYEPCVVEKALELQTVYDIGVYQKSKYENINSIVKGIHEYKGSVSLHFEKLDCDAIDFDNSRKNIICAITSEIDRIVHKNYALFKTNYMAYDISLSTTEFSAKYSSEELKVFKEYIKECHDNLSIQKRILQLYAVPVFNALK